MLRAPLVSLVLLATVSLAASACGGPSATPSDARPAPAELGELGEAARAWQLAYEDALRDDPESFLTAVASHYLGPGQRVGLARVDGQWTEHDPPSVAFELNADGELTVTRGDETLEIRERRSIPAPDDGTREDARASFVVSPQSSRWRILVHDHRAPARVEFDGLPWFAIDPALIVPARYQPTPERSPTKLQTSRGEAKTLYLAATLSFELGGQPRELRAFAYAPAPTPSEDLLVPFKDQTTGEQSYGAGRYLELEAPAGDALTLDFNRATNPLCAYSEHYNCPMPPRFNAIDHAIQAGAKTPSH